MEPLLTAQHLRKKFGKLTAVDDITINVQAGECLALLGPNGAGKTTTVEMLEGLQTPDSGEIRIFGQSLRTARQSIMQNVGVMLQETQLYKKLTVKETLELFASFFAKSLKVDDAIAMVELSDKRDSRLEQLSGGQMQRAYLACSLINEPRLLFLDEPTTGLDPQSRRMIWDLLQKHKGRDRGILLTTHYMDEAEKLADRVAVVDHGRIIAEGSPSQLIQTHCGEQVVCFRYLGLEPAAVRDRLQAHLPWLKEAVVIHNSFELVARDPVQIITELSRASDQQNLKLAQLEMRRSTLEDVFIKLTGRSIRDA
ncbi:MAG TPA: ABC transporter ATP-binding protein [Oligoflexus sp.]|uniref:ABC transporter ATP-binding protein n=1 Tax=Oligoflexus sp. TaxID=1971216 RepID=UPI002D36482D|nr:ABC transporter ATP-binding protein [Oligoflexus sp.]HYX32633.1 ABC transporter ATP-binding protein [Oligoflexus sp.]